ncbi:hypothetical protein PoB_000869700 [Plakobranchus ocellatus]|uniref:Uncharacterized protein n=1 Tax=Plakobranchus ocellatus TaxID=259542 RepID=A0AAV3YJ31_9GAST|nr:hypothetical protein PoB_000869700 [Plakobranchus ocellatus]
MLTITKQIETVNKKKNDQDSCNLRSSPITRMRQFTLPERSRAARRLGVVSVGASCYSHLAPFDFWIFPKMKENHRGHRFESE